jgi:hypothetical protein
MLGQCTHFRPRHAVVLAAFLLVWGDGLPTLDGSVFEQLATIQAAVLSVVMPWVAARCGAQRRDCVTIVAATIAVLPSRMLWARCVALGMALCALLVTGLPMTILAQRISALSPEQAFPALLPVLAMSCFVAVATTAGAMLIFSPMALWLVATVATAAALRVLPAGAGSSTAFLGLAILGSATLALTANSTLRYLPERMRTSSRPFGLIEYERPPASECDQRAANSQRPGNASEATRH